MKGLLLHTLTLTLIASVLGFSAQAQQRCENPGDPFVGGDVLQPALLKSGPGNIQGQWSSGASLPVPKKFHTVGYAGGEIFIFGGVTTGNIYNATSWKYTPSTDKWTQLPDYPVARWLYGRAATVNGKIYIMGGLDNLGASYKTVADVYEYDPTTNRFTKKASMSNAQGYAAIGVIDNRIYLIAGSGATDASYTTIVQVYDPATDSWARNTDYPRNVRYKGAASVGNKIVVTGGYNVSFTPSRYIADTYVGELEAGLLKWTKVKDYPIGGTIFISGVGVNDKAFFIGGRPSIDGNAPATQRCYSYEVASDKWNTLDLKPTGMQGIGQCGTDGNKVYVPGGEDATANALSVMEILDAGAQGGPVAFVNETTFIRTIKQGASSSLSITVKNNGSAALTWSASVEGSASSWISFPNSNGSIDPIQQNTIPVTINGAALTNGTHNGRIILATNDPNNASINIDIMVYVQSEDVDTDMNILVEEYSGHWCGWCPDGVDSLHVLKQTFGSRVIVVTYHNNDAQSTPAGNQILSMLGVTGYPTASFNRVISEGATSSPISRGIWVKTASDLLNTRRSPVSISYKNKVYNPSTKQLSFDIEVFFHQGMNGDLRLNLIQTNDSANYAQVRYNPTRVVYPYYHEAAVYHVLPNAQGEPLNQGTGNIASQTKVVKSFSFASLDSIPDLSNLVAFVHRFDGGRPGEVLQTYTEKVTDNVTLSAGDLPTVEQFVLSQNYPNPFNPSTTISYALPVRTPVSIVVTDVFGRTIGTLANSVMDAGVHSVTLDAKNLASGNYFFTMRAGNFVQTRTMTLMK